MSTLLSWTIIIAVFFGGAYLYERFIGAPKRRREALAAPRITLSEARSFWDAIEASTLPIAYAKVQNRPPLSPSESRICGPALAICNGAKWPFNEEEQSPMFLLAQLNFADMPVIDGFPGHGILQVFVSMGMTDEIAGNKHVIRFDPSPSTLDLLDVPDEIQKTPRWNEGFSKTTRCVGLPLVFEVGTAQGNPYNWPFVDNELLYANRLPENDDVAVIMDSWEKREEDIVRGYGDHWVGGHPNFVQYDVRKEFPQLRHLDRVLLHIGGDEHINLGDSGELNVMISQDALLKKEFDQAYVTWDCA